MRAFSAMVGAAATVLLLAGCVGVSTPVPAPPTTAALTPTEEPAPTPSPVLVPTRLLDGDCARLLPADAAPAELGDVTPDSYPGWTPVGTVGGIVCAYPDGPWTRIEAVPRGIVPDAIVDRYRETVCEPNDDDVVCRLGREAGDAWVLVQLGREPSALLEQTLDVAAAAIAAAAPAVPVDRTNQWWPQTACPDLGARVDLAGYFGTSEFSEGYPGHAGRDALAAALEAYGATLGVCQWYAFDDVGVRTLRFRAYPGGGWDADRQKDALTTRAPTPDAVETVEVEPGVDATIATYGDVRIGWMSDGVNLVDVELRGGQHPDLEMLQSILAALRG